MPGGGFVAGGFDARDRTYTYLGDRTDPKDFRYANLWKDHPEWFTPIYNQVDSNSCVANSTAALIRYAAYQTDQADAHEALSDPSRMFIYYNARALQFMGGSDRLTWPSSLGSKEDPDGGCSTRNAMKSLNLVGIAPEKAWPWVTNLAKRPEDTKGGEAIEQTVVVDINSRPSVEAYRAAQKNFTFEYCRLDPDHTNAAEKVLTAAEKHAIGVVTLARMKQCLVEGYPVVFGYWNFYESGQFNKAHDKRDEEKEDLWGSINPLLLPPRTRHGGHSVVAVGFKDDAPTNPPQVDAELKGRVLCQNSWGPGSENDDHFWMSYEYILDFDATDDFWMLRFLEKGAPRTFTREDFQKIETPDPGPPEDWAMYTLDKPATQANTAVGRPSTFAMTSRPTGIVDLYWINEDGSARGGVFTGVSEPGSTKAPEWQQHPENKPLAPPGDAFKGAIIASTGAANAKETRWDGVDIKWITPDGAIKSVFRPTDELHYKATESYPPGTAQPNGGLACVTLPTGSLAFWWVQPDGSIRGFSWSWKSTTGYTKEAAPSGSAQVTQPVSTGENPQPTSTLTALKSDEKGVHLWWITPEGKVQGKRYEDDWREVHDVAPARSAALGTRIAAVSRVPGVIDLFFISPSGEVKYFNGLAAGAKPVWKEDKMFTKKVGKYLNDKIEEDRLLPLAIARVDSDIKAVSINPDRVDVFWVHPNNSLLQATIQTGKTEFVELLEPGAVMAGSPLGVVSQRLNNIVLAYKSSKGLTKVIEFGSKK